MRTERVSNDHIDVSRCEACGRCVTACKQGALEIAAFKRVNDVHIARPKRCTGCLSCVAACRQRAVQPASVADE